MRLRVHERNLERIDRKELNLDYLDEVHGVVRKDTWIGELKPRDRATDQAV